MRRNSFLVIAHHVSGYFCCGGPSFSATILEKAFEQVSELSIFSSVGHKLTARSGIVWAGAGMLVATLFTLLYPGLSNYPLMLAAIALIPMVELSGFTARADASWELYASSALPTRELLGLLVPFIFGGFWTPSGTVPYVGSTGDSGYAGLLAIALALAAPLLLPGHRREAGLWLTLMVVEVLLCLGPATPIGALFYYAPGYAGFQAPLRHLFLVTLCLSVSSGLAIAFASITTEICTVNGATLTPVAAAIRFLRLRCDPDVPFIPSISRPFGRNRHDCRLRG